MRGFDMRALLVVAALAAMPLSDAHAQSEADRLREALRSATVQLRALEDQRAVLQARQAEAERERDRLRKQTELLRAQVKEAEQAYRQAVEDFNERLSERDKALELWKNAYGDAATVARTKDAERAKFEQEAAAFKASTRSCEGKNAKLYNVSREMLKRYEAMNPLEAAVVHEPLIGLKRVDHQNLIQDFHDKLLDQRIKP